MDRRTDLAENALAYVLTHGLIGLSLRPLAAELGTSDRMLIYHFGSKEGLITEVVTLANRRLAESLTADSPPIGGVPDLVRYAWETLTVPDRIAVQALYLELCALSVREPQRWTAAQEQLRGPWLTAIREALAVLDVSPSRVPALADLVLDTFDGLLLDRLVGADPARSDAAAEEFAALLEHI